MVIAAAEKMPRGSLSKLTVDQVDFNGKKVICRVDYNVPLREENGTYQVANNQRITATLPTLRCILEKGAQRIVLLSHLGRPDGKVVPSMSLKPVAEELAKLLAPLKVQFMDECVGPRVDAALEASTSPIILLENLRFHVEEEGTVKRKDGSKETASQENVQRFRASLTKLGSVFVNDAFGAAHRAHSSIVGINLPVRAAGLLMQRELEYFGHILEAPAPSVDLAILGGSKVADKIQLIENLLPRVRTMAIGGAMCFTFRSILDKMPIGKSIFDEEGAKLVPSIMAKAKSLGVSIWLPKDFVTGDKIKEDARIGEASLAKGGILEADMMGLDVGTESCAELTALIRNSKMVLWNGPVGVFEVSHFAKGTKAVVQALVEATANGATTIVGGGDSGAAVAQFANETQLSHVSTGGGASLELLEGKILPGIAALSNQTL